jgi:hypothetical protein
MRSRMFWTAVILALLLLAALGFLMRVGRAAAA